MKYITLFETAAAYNAATLDLPNVSLIEENMGVTYNPYVSPETKVVTKYNVTSTSSPTSLRTNFEQNVFKSMEIDGIILNELVTEYTFDTTGEHIVKYELYDESKLGYSAPVFYNRNLIECIIPDGVTSIGNNAFLDCAMITSVTIPSSVTSIGSYAFTNCSSLTSINIPSSVISISERAFENCGLTSIDIPDSVISIGTMTFLNCINLISCTIGNGVTSISAGAFSGCSSLTSINIPSGVTIISERAFYNCTGITNVIIPNSVTSIGNVAFNNCSNLTSIDIPNSVRNINAGAFGSCSSLTIVTIGSGVTSIGDSAFRECSSLTNIVSNTMSAPTISNNTFQNIKTGGILTVPASNTGYDVWMRTDDYYLGKYNWTKVEQ